MKTWIKLLLISSFIALAIYSGTNDTLFGTGPYAMGYFATGQFAAGIFAAGQFSIGIFSIGIFSIGIFSIGVFNIGIYVTGIFLLWKKHGNGTFRLTLLARGPISRNLAVLLLLCTSAFVHAQLPNGNMESWQDHVNYMEPEGFATANPLVQGTTYPVSRSLDVPPNSNGTYSARIECNADLLPAGAAYGLMLQNPDSQLMQGLQPSFPLDDHYMQLQGYFKYAPDQGDQMLILVLFYEQGAIVSTGSFSSADTTNEWSSFSVVMSPYNQADSFAILIGAYYAMGGPQNYSPQGNSILFIDDLHFSKSTVSTMDVSKDAQLSVYPNPASNQLLIRSQEPLCHVLVMDLSGKLWDEYHPHSCKVELDPEQWPEGLYLIRMETAVGVVQRKILVRH